MKLKKVSPCIDIHIQEFQKLKFGKSNEDDLWYFDATAYLLEEENIDKRSIESFIEKTKWTINALSDYYTIPSDDLIIIETETKHILMEESLTLHFLSFIDPYLILYIHERMIELFKNGFAVSDTALAAQLKMRFTEEDIKEIYQLK